MLIYQEFNSFYKLIIIFFLYFQLIFFHYVYKKLKNYNVLKKHNIPVIHDYKLYDEIENPLISIIFNLSTYNFYFINEELKHFINDTLQFKSIDIQI